MTPTTTHPPDACAGQACCIHNPSPHHMAGWSLIHRLDRVVFQDGREIGVLSERICPHGIGHPDPDSLSFLHAQGAGEWVAVHGCDGCCNGTAT